MDQKKLAPGGNKLFPFSDGFSTGSTLGPRWTGSTWSISGGKAVNTPTVIDTEMLVNPGLEAPYSGGVANGWTIRSTATLTEENVIIHGGSSSQKIVTSGVDQGIYQNLGSPVAGTWYTFSGWGYRASGAGPSKFLTFTAGGVVINTIFSAASWSNVIGVTRHVSGTFTVDSRQGGSGSCEYYIDDLSVKPLSLPTLFSSVDAKKSNVSVSVNATLFTTLARHCAGVVVCLDSPSSPANFLLAYHDGTKAYLEKCVGGTYTNLINQTVTYSAGAAIKVVKNGNFVSMYYNGSQVGTTQIVTDAGIINNTRHGMFSTYSGNTLDDFSISLPTYIFADAFATALDASWTSTNWSVASGAAVSTPTAGSELLTNGGFSAWTGDNPDNWTIAGESGSDPMITEVGSGEDHTGAGSGSANVYSSSALVTASQNAIPSMCLLRSVVGISYRGSGAVNLSTYPRIPGLNSVATYTISQLHASGTFTFARQAGSTDVTIDSISCKQLPLAQAIASVSSGMSDCTVQVSITAGAAVYSIAGVVACLDSSSNPQNFITAFFIRMPGQSDAVLVYKVVNGVMTLLTSGAITYGAGYVLKLIKSGTSVSAYYNGTIVGSTQTVSDASVISNTYHGMISSEPGTTLDNFSIG